MNTGNKSTFYDRFIELCQEYKEKPTPVLKKLGFSAGNIKKWSNGSTASPDILIALSNYFNVTIDYLLGNTNDTEKITKSGTTVKVLYTSPIEAITVQCPICYKQYDGMDSEIADRTIKNANDMYSTNFRCPVCKKTFAINKENQKIVLCSDEDDVIKNRAKKVLTWQ